MRNLKLLGLALLAIFAFGAVIASTAAAEEKEPAGLLFLGAEKAPVGIKVAEEAIKTSLKANKLEVTCETFLATGEAGAGETTHVTLGTLNVTYKNCTTEAKALKCTSEGSKGEKDVNGTILLAAVDTDLHFVSLLEGAKLVPGVLIGLLELAAGFDLTLNCGAGVVKVKVLGAIFFKVNNTKAELEKDVEALKLEPTSLTCDTNDALCKEELKKWAAVVGGVTCPLAATFKEPKDEECAVYTSPAVTAKLDKKVLVDY